MTSLRSVAADVRPLVRDAPVPPATLADEHRVLLRDVRRRTAAILALLDVSVWPASEIETLTRYLQGSVLRQASQEEALLYPHDASAPLARLVEDHAELQELTEQLNQAAAVRPVLGDLRVLVDRLLTALRAHLTAERALLTDLADAPTDPPSTASVATLRPAPAAAALDGRRNQEASHPGYGRLTA